MLKQNQGVALIEALISVLVVSFGVVSLVKFQADLHGSQNTSVHRTEAQALAQAVVNKVAGSTSPATYGNGTDSPAGKSTTYQRSWTISTSLLGDTLVVSQVSWLDNKGQSDKVVLSSVVAKDAGLNEGKLLASAGALGSAGTGTGTGTGSNASPPWTVITVITPPPPPEGPPPNPPIVTLPPDTTVTTFIISGVITLANSVKIGDVEVFSIRGTEVIPCNMATGSVPYGYSCKVPSGWTGRIDLEAARGHGKKDFQEAPDFRDYSAVSVNLTAQNFSVTK